jgi:hypothetical protein
MQSGGTPASILLIAASVAAMAPFAADRHERYTQLWRDDPTSRTAGVDPRERWRMVPGWW